LVDLRPVVLASDSGLGKPQSQQSQLATNFGQIRLTIVHFCHSASPGRSTYIIYTRSRPDFKRRTGPDGPPYDRGLKSEEERVVSEEQHGVSFPGESDEYRRARNGLLGAELELRRQIEAVAAQRRNLPLGGEVRTDYEFEEADAKTVRLSERNVRLLSSAATTYNHD
jgi:hypothetical protein